jgi:hypothetical protein
MLQLLLTKLGSIRLYLELAAIAVITSLVVYSNILQHSYNNLNDDYGQVLSNVTAYQSLINDNQNNTRVLSLKLADLSHSNDSVILELSETRKSLKRAENDLKWASTSTNTIHDTIVVKVPVVEPLPTPNICDFELTVTSDPQTAITVIRRADSLVVIPNIINTADLFITDTKIWRNPNKNFFKRLFTWDWRKDIVQEFDIINSNKDIKTTNVRVINVNNK